MEDAIAPAKTLPENLGRIFHTFPFVSKGKIFTSPPQNLLNTLTPLLDIILFAGIRDVASKTIY
jgi:hypothetical protein